MNAISARFHEWVGKLPETNENVFVYMTTGATFEAWFDGWNFRRVGGGFVLSKYIMGWDAIETICQPERSIDNARALSERSSGERAGDGA